MITGNLQRRWSAQEPAVYDKETRLVCMDIKSESRPDDQGQEVPGYSYFEVEIDRQIDYGHIKSQLIEAGFAQKDEFGMLMNSVDGILTAISQSSSWAKFKENLDTEDIQKFSEFCQYRAMCAEAAKEVMRHY